MDASGRVSEADLYGDIFATNKLTYNEMAKLVADKTNELDKLGSRVGYLTTKNELLEEKNRLLERSIMSLLLTSKNEIARKDRTISELREIKNK